MATMRGQESEPSQPVACQIRVEGHLGREWADWFDGLTITQRGSGQTQLSGQVADQAALHGLLKRVRDLGIPLLSVVCVKAGQVESATVIEAHQARSEEEP